MIAKIGDIVAIEWMDAVGEQKEDKAKLDSIEPKNLLTLNTTYGIYYKKDKIATVILQEDNESSVDYTVIPNKWILKIIKLKEDK